MLVFDRKIVVAGAGYIAVELAGVLKELGSDVTLLIRRTKVSDSCKLVVNWRTLTEELQAVDRLLGVFQENG
jgi:glutathione reductase (NADPH)